VVVVGLRDLTLEMDHSTSLLLEVVPMKLMQRNFLRHFLVVDVEGLVDLDEVQIFKCMLGLRFRKLFLVHQRIYI